MKTNTTRTIMIIGCLIAATCVAMAYSNHKSRPAAVVPTALSVKNGVITLAGSLVQDKVFAGGDGTVDLSLTLKADDVLNSDRPDSRHVDMVIVLDRSGSMQGKKIEDAKEAVLKLLSYLTEKDRFALISYSDDVRVHSGLAHVTSAGREHFSSMVQKISAGGGTNLGAGLRTGMDTLIKGPKIGNPGRVILISDGLANQGITDPAVLSKMASAAAREEFAVSTVGVGSDFNEQLMTALADHGTGTYYYLENPSAFTVVFEKEFRDTRAVAARMVTVEVPLPDGVSLVHAAGYPIEMKENQAVFHPGDLLSGQTRKLFLRMQIPTGKEQIHKIKGITVKYQYDGKPYQAMIADPFCVACVNDPKKAIASVNKKEWVQKVLEADYNRLREEVAADIKKGDEEKALSRIEAYQTEKETINEVIDSSEVAGNLQKDLKELRQTVKDTFCGAPAAVAIKQKKNAKALQFEGYQGKRQAQ